MRFFFRTPDSDESPAGILLTCWIYLVYQVTSAVERYVALCKHPNFRYCNRNWHAIFLTFVSSALSYGINESFAVHSQHEFMLAEKATGLEEVTKTKQFNQSAFVNRLNYAMALIKALKGYETIDLRFQGIRSG
jgi:hypothetical protein